MNGIDTTTSRGLRDGIVGKCIEGVIARPGRAGEPPVVMMLRFDDGTTLEFVSPSSDRLLRQAVETTRRGRPQSAPDQLALAVA